MKINGKDISVAPILTIAVMLVSVGGSWATLNSSVGNLEEDLASLEVLVGGIQVDADHKLMEYKQEQRQRDTAQWERLNEIQAPIAELKKDQAVTQQAVEGIDKTLNKVDRDIQRILNKLDSQ